MPLIVTCAQCEQEILQADQVGDGEECILRDHLLAVYPNTVQPAILESVLLRHIVVTEQPPAE